MIERLKNLVVKQDRFDVLKKQVRRTLKNFSKNQPHAQARYFLDMSTVTPRCSLKEKLAVIDGTTDLDLDRIQKKNKKIGPNVFIS